jgi:hypothetical protein
VRRGTARWSGRGREEWHRFREHGSAASSPRGLSATAPRQQDYSTERDCNVHPQDPDQDPVPQAFWLGQHRATSTSRAGDLPIGFEFPPAAHAVSTCQLRFSSSAGTACLLLLCHTVRCDREVSALAHKGQGWGAGERDLRSSNAWPATQGRIRTRAERRFAAADSCPSDLVQDALRLRPVPTPTACGLLEDALHPASICAVGCWSCRFTRAYRPRLRDEGTPVEAEPRRVAVVDAAAPAGAGDSRIGEDAPRACRP